MSEGKPWTKRRTGKARGRTLVGARWGRVATSARVAIATSEGAGPSTSTPEPSSASATPVAALPEPQVASVDPAVGLALPNPGVESDSEYESEPEEGEFDDDKAQSIFDDFMVALPLYYRRMLAVVLMESFRKRQQMNIKEAAQETGSIVGWNEKTVRKYRKDFFDNKGELGDTRQGKYKRMTVYQDEEVSL